MVDRIRKKRKQLGMTQSELAERCGCNWKSISNLERGCTCNGKLLTRVCEELGLSLAIIDNNPVEEKKEKPTRANNTRVQIID